MEVVAIPLPATWGVPKQQTPAPSQFEGIKPATRGGSAWTLEFANAVKAMLEMAGVRPLASLKLGYISREEPAPSTLASLDASIRKSRSILTEKWYGDDAIALSEDTWKRAASIIWKMAWQLSREGLEVPVPDIAPLVDGSIDVDWTINNREILLNVPASSDRPVEFYGDDGNRGKRIRGSFDVAEPAKWLLMWLME